MYVFLTPQNIYFVHPSPLPSPRDLLFSFIINVIVLLMFFFNTWSFFFFVIYANSAHVVAVPVVVVAVVMTHGSWYSFG